MFKPLLWAALFVPTLGIAAPIPADHSSSRDRNVLPSTVEEPFETLEQDSMDRGGTPAMMQRDDPLGDLLNRRFGPAMYDPAADPLDRRHGHAMFDPLGTGCIDGGGVDDPFPSGKGDMRVAAFCIPQPCARPLSEQELARDVLGRALREDEYATYLVRLAAACSELAFLADDLDAFALVAGPETMRAAEAVVASAPALPGPWGPVPPGGGTSGPSIADGLTPVPGPGRGHRRLRPRAGVGRCSRRRGRRHHRGAGRRVTRGRAGRGRPSRR